jgi:hypothetical protein
MFGGSGAMVDVSLECVARFFRVEYIFGLEKAIQGREFGRRRCKRTAMIKKITLFTMMQVLRCIPNATGRFVAQSDWWKHTDSSPFVCSNNVPTEKRLPARASVPPVNAGWKRWQGASIGG